MHQARGDSSIRRPAGLLPWPWLLLGALACSSGDDQRPARAGWDFGGSSAPTAVGGNPQAGESPGSGGQDTVGEAGAPIVASGGSDVAGGVAAGGNGGAGGQIEPKPLAGECLADPLQAPSAGQCVHVGDPGYACNPVTGVPCDRAGGQTCEFVGAGFSCQSFAAEKNAPCRPCNPVLAASCAVGFTCRGTLERCTRYCCDNGDCGVGADCVAQPPSVVGICQATSALRLQDFGWNFPPPDAGADAAVDAPPPVDCPSCSAQSCADQEQACSSDADCAACLASSLPADTCFGLLSLQLLYSCRCSHCNDLCSESCL